jgi:hypothetical protein
VSRQARQDRRCPAFIRELLRRASPLAIERGEGAPETDGLVVHDDELSAALDELTADRGQLTAKLLGRRGPDREIPL